MSTFKLTEEQRAIRDAIERLCEKFDDDYWLKLDQDGGFPEDFVKAIADDGWLGIAMPEKHSPEAEKLYEQLAEAEKQFNPRSKLHV